MKYFLFILLAGYAVRCDDNYYVIQIPDELVRQKPFKVYWNVPTKQCKSKQIPFGDLYQKFGIIQNSEDKFIGEKITILYDPGLFPALFKDGSNGQFRFRNGGVPQQGDLEKHLAQIKIDLDANVPEDFNGIGIIDFESWRPIYRQNFGELRPYKDVSYEIEKNNHWWWSKARLEAEAKRRFEESGQLFMQQTLELVRRVRPRGAWGFYGFPYCYNMAQHNMREECSPHVEGENDRLKWLWRGSSALYPSLYSSSSLSSTQLAAMIRGRVREAARCAKGTPVLPYFWFRYREGEFLRQADLDIALETVYRSNASGLIIWGSSNDVNTVDKCHKLYNYVDKVLGPAIAKYTKIQNDEITISTIKDDITSTDEQTDNNTFLNDNITGIDNFSHLNINQGSIDINSTFLIVNKTGIENVNNLNKETDRKEEINTNHRVTNIDDSIFGNDFMKNDSFHIIATENITEIDEDKIYNEKIQSVISSNEYEISKKNNLLYLDLVLKAIQNRYEGNIEALLEVPETIDNIDFDIDYDLTTEHAISKDFNENNNNKVANDTPVTEIIYTTVNTLNKTENINNTAENITESNTALKTESVDNVTDVINTTTEPINTINKITVQINDSTESTEITEEIFTVAENIDVSSTDIIDNLTDIPITTENIAQTTENIQYTTEYNDYTSIKVGTETTEAVKILDLTTESPTESLDYLDYSTDIGQATDTNEANIKSTEQENIGTVFDSNKITQSDLKIGFNSEQSTQSLTIDLLTNKNDFFSYTDNILNYDTTTQITEVSKVLKDSMADLDGIKILKDENKMPITMKLEGPKTAPNLDEQVIVYL